MPPPPPIPKRTFRSKCDWSIGEKQTANGGGSTTATTTTPNLKAFINTTDDGHSTRNYALPGQQSSSQQQQQQQFGHQENNYINAAALIYSQHNSDYFNNHALSDAVGDIYAGDNNVNKTGLVEDVASNIQQYMSTNSTDDSALARPGSFYYTVKGELDSGSISDDDRMSLENSVFEDSLTSTPVKIGHSGNIGKYNNANPKRSTHFSSSTIDSGNTSGYGSHNERFSSSSTTAEFRSRFSSVDTQSSLDSSHAERVTNSPLYRGGNLEYNNYNNNTTCNSNNNSNNHNNNNNAQVTKSKAGSGNSIYPRTTGQSGLSDKQINAAAVPAVPLRKSLKCGGGVNGTTSSLNLIAKHSSTDPDRDNGTETITIEELSPIGNIQNGHQGASTVSSSTSTSSAASAISGISSTSLISSLEPSLNLPNVCELSSENSSLDGIKNSTPPTPPLRNQLIVATKVLPPVILQKSKLNKNRSPPTIFPKLHQPREPNIPKKNTSTMSSATGCNSKNRHNSSSLSQQQQQHQFIRSDTLVTQYDQCMGLTNGNISDGGESFARSNLNYRQDSTISSDSFSQTSSPGYNVKIIEAPLLPSLSLKKLKNVPMLKLQNEPIDEMEPPSPVTNQYTKCSVKPTSLQTIVRFQNGSPNTMSLQHQIINRRKNSTLFITNGRLKFRLFQIVINALALLAIAGGLAAYFNAYPTIKFVNKTIINTIHVEDTSSFGKNPAPGTCLPIIVKFCQGNQIPYNYTVFPNYIGHFGQLETQVDLEAYEALVDVRCYDLVSLFLCTLFVPKCGSTGATVPPCKTLCTETMRRCGFFFDVFGLSLPEYLNCKLFKDFENAEECVGLDEVRDVMIASANPKCDGFQCDQNRCIPNDYICDGHLDCMDQADEANCERCSKDQIYCGDGACVSSKHICDGILDCPYGQDERNCIRLSNRNGDVGLGILEVFRISNHEWTPACVKNWDRDISSATVCSILGYNSSNGSIVVTQKTHRTLMATVNVSSDIWGYPKKRANLMREFCNCTADEDYPIAELTCLNFDCGKVKQLRRHQPVRRIIGGKKAHPGSWPFLAAILGGPEKIFYCAGVLISDEWVLTASHCIGNHTLIDLEDWTIQLGVTRRNSFTYSGQRVKVKTVIPHPQYNTAIAHDNDIALFQLASRVAFHEHLLPVCLPPSSVKQLRHDQMCTVIGWGKREDKDPKSTYEPIVNEVQVPIIRRQQCDDWLDNLTVSEGMICAGYEDGGKDACQGDSGGPLLCPYPGEKDRWFVGGIVSWGIMCAHPKLPGVYANVIKYVPWIQEEMQKHSTPANTDNLSKYDAHPGGPDILSNMATNSVKKLQYQNRNHSPAVFGAARLP